MVADAILVVVGEVGMGRTEQTAHVLIVLAVLVGVADKEAYWGAGRLAFEDAAEKLDLVGFLAVGGYVALTWASAVELALDEVDVDVDACWHAVDDTTNGWTVAFAEGCQAEKITECIAHIN